LDENNASREQTALPMLISAVMIGKLYHYGTELDWTLQISAGETLPRSGILSARTSNRERRQAAIPLSALIAKPTAAVLEF